MARRLDGWRTSMRSCVPPFITPLLYDHAHTVAPGSTDAMPAERSTCDSRTYCPVLPGPHLASIFCPSLSSSPRSALGRTLFDAPASPSPAFPSTVTTALPLRNARRSSALRVDSPQLPTAQLLAPTAQVQWDGASASGVRARSPALDFACARRQLRQGLAPRRKRPKRRSALVRGHEAHAVTRHGCVYSPTLRAHGWNARRAWRSIAHGGWLPAA